VYSDVDFDEFGMGGNFTRTESNPADNVKAAADNVTNKWASELKLNESEKLNASVLAERYITEYVQLKKESEGSYGNEFMNAYLMPTHLESRKEEDIRKWKEQQAQIEKYIAANPDYESKMTDVNLKFLELQLKYQKEMKYIISFDKENLIREQQPVLLHFPQLK
jgi:hypothetical protein